MLKSHQPSVLEARGMLVMTLKATHFFSAPFIDWSAPLSTSVKKAGPGSLFMVLQTDVGPTETLPGLLSISGDRGLNEKLLWTQLLPITPDATKNIPVWHASRQIKLADNELFKLI